jgi:hypothetical protein
MSVVILRVVGAIEGRADQLAIGEAFLIRGWFGWHGIERIFQNRTTCKIAPAAKSHHLRAGRAEYATTLKPVIVGPEV